MTEGSPIAALSSNVSTLLDSAPDAMVIVDAGGQIVFVNAQTEALFGYDRVWLIGQQVELLLPERLRDVHHAHRHTFAADPAMRPMGAGLQLSGCRSDGSEFPVEISLSPVQTPSGLLVSAAIRDVTARVKVEQELKVARDEARRASRAKGAFLAAASHDLRQPLQTLKLLTAVLARSVDKPGAIEAVERQNVALDAMTDLLDALQDISQLESGSIAPNLTDCSVAEMFARLHAQFEPQASEKGLTLEVEHNDSVVRTDPGLLEQIVHNLVANAIRYTDRGEVCLRCADAGEAIRIEVQDTGIGIAREEMDAIFEEFYQIGSGDPAKTEGLGLGLSIVRRLAGLLQLPLQLQSQPGVGTCFSLDVPRGASGTHPATGAAPRSAPKSRSATVLIIDDDPAVADAVRMLLEIEGHDVLRAVTSSEARRQIEVSGVPDVILSDYHLGDGENGLDAIEQMRLDTGRVMPAVLVTGDASSAVREHAGQMQQCYVLSKPVDTDELLSLIHRWAPSD